VALIARAADSSVRAASTPRRTPVDFALMESVMDIGKFVDRRLHPVRVALGLMNHELELARADQAVNVDKEVLRSLIETMQMFIEDFEQQYRASREQSQKKFVTATQTATAGKVG
jgi:hypothetical protein